MRHHSQYALGGSEERPEADTLGRVYSPESRADGSVEHMLSQDSPIFRLKVLCAKHPNQKMEIGKVVENSVSSVPRRPHARKGLSKSAVLEILSGSQQPGAYLQPQV